MALVTRATDASMGPVSAMFAPQVTGIAGEDLDVVAPCYIKGADGLIYMGDGTAADEKALIAGLTPRACKQGEPITLFGIGARFKYAAAGTLTPGVKLFVAATPGRLDTAATIGDATGIVQAISDTDVRVVRAV